jgi:hypothetical protein
LPDKNLPNPEGSKVKDEYNNQFKTKFSHLKIYDGNFETLAHSGFDFIKTFFNQNL